MAQEKRDYYEVLGVSKTATDVLLAAVHRLVKAQGDAHADVLTLAGSVGVRLTGRAAKAAEAAAKDIAENVTQIHAVAAETAKAAQQAAGAQPGPDAGNNQQKPNDDGVVDADFKEV